jgi:hypothetical protein
MSSPTLGTMRLLCAAKWAEMWLATGWTECLPWLYKSQETVLEAVQQARRLFPFPILGLDTDENTVCPYEL